MRLATFSRMSGSSCPHSCGSHAYVMPPARPSTAGLVEGKVAQSPCTRSPARSGRASPEQILGSARHSAASLSLSVSIRWGGGKVQSESTV
eukprot:scaffold112872_cov39-Tisochrysis_lutea.AAC.4